MFDAIGHSVVKLRRVQIGPIDDAGLPVGKWRLLDVTEVKRLLSGKAPVAPARPARLGKPSGPTRRNEGRPAKAKPRSKRRGV